MDSKIHSYAPTALRNLQVMQGKHGLPAVPVRALVRLKHEFDSEDIGIRVPDEPLRFVSSTTQYIQVISLTLEGVVSTDKTVMPR